MSAATLDGRSLTTRVTVLAIGAIFFSLFLANALFERAGAAAIDREVARACYERAGWLAVEMQATLDSSGAPTERSKELLYRAAQEMDVSLVMFYEADVPIVTAHGRSLTSALRHIEKYPRAGTFMDSGDTPWVPRFSADIDRSRYPDRGGRPVRVQEHYPYSVETPVGSRMSLRVVPLQIEPVDAGAFNNRLFVVGLMLGLAALLVVGRMLKPLNSLADGVARLGRGDRSRIRVSGSGEIARIARTSNRMADLVIAAQDHGQRVLSTVGGAFKEPVGLAWAVAEGLDTEAVPPAVRGELEELIAHVGDLSRVVDSMNLWTELEAGRVELDRESEDFRALVEETAADYAMETTFDFADDVDDELDLDGEQFRVVLEHLLDNSVLHGDGPLQISVERGHTKIELAVRDHGDGIEDLDEMRRVFEPFCRAEAAEGPGLGLGLRIVRLVMDLHNGGVSIRNHPEGGLEVRLWLPAPPIRVSEVDRSVLSMGWSESADVPLVVAPAAAADPMDLEPAAAEPEEEPAAAEPTDSTELMEAVDEVVEPVEPLSAPETVEEEPTDRLARPASVLDPHTADLPEPQAMRPPVHEEPEEDAGEEEPAEEPRPPRPVIDTTDPSAIPASWDQGSPDDSMFPEETASTPIGPVPIPAPKPRPPPAQLEEDPFEPF